MKSKSMICFTAMLIVVLFTLTASGQISNIIPSDRVVDWTKAGLDHNPPMIEDVVYIDNADSLVSFLENKDPNIMTLVELDEGTYTFTNSLVLPSRTILRGKGSDKTIIDFNVNTYGFKISPALIVQDTANILNVNELSKGTSTIVVDDISGLSMGNLIIMLFGVVIDSMYHFHSKGACPIPNYECSGIDFIGQVNIIKDISGNIVELEDGCRLDYSTFDHGRVIFLNNTSSVSNIGIENLKIKSSSFNTPELIHIEWSYNCWIRGVETEKPMKRHIVIKRSTNIEISGCYIHDSYLYGGGGEGYGVNVSYQSTNVLVENNSFRHLRAPMILSYGANGNVFTYNYSDSSQDFNGKIFRSISIHGHFPFCNLFEGNVIDFINIDAWWGPSGPYNTFFRNRTKLIDILIPPEEQIEGFCIKWCREYTNQDDVVVSGDNVNFYGQNLVGNRCDFNRNHFFYKGIEMDSAYYFYPRIDQSQNYLINNKQSDENGIITDYGQQTSEFIGYSYFYESKPSFMDSLCSWPFDPNNYTQLPAYIRLFNQEEKTFNNWRYLKIMNKSIAGGNNLSGTLGISIPEESINYDIIPSGYHLQIPNRTVYTDVRTHNRILNGQTHLNWDNDPKLYRMSEYNVGIDQYSNSIDANFEYQKNVIIKSSIAIPVPHQIQDPWLVQNTEEFTEISDTIYQVFLKQNEDFDSRFPIYRLKAPYAVATTDSIYVFEKWIGDNAEFAPGISETSQRETDVVFKSENATVTAHYVSANKEGKTVTVAQGETLEIPAGGNYTIANNNFKIVVKGSLSSIGTEENPIVFESQQPSWGGIEVSGQGQVTLQNTTLINASIGLQVNADVSKTMIVKNCIFEAYNHNAINSFAPVEISGCVFANPNLFLPAVKIEIDDENVEDYKIVNNTFVNNATGIMINFSSNPDHNKIRIDNNIIFNNTGNDLNGINIVGDIGNNDVKIGYNDIYGYDSNNFGNAVLTDNLFEDPLLADPSNGDFHLTLNSPCIDKGNIDLDGDGITWENDPDDQDPDGTRMDMGAFYYDATPAVPTGFIVTGDAGEHPLLTWNPNTEPDLNHYNIYRRLTDSQSTYYLIATTTENSYADEYITIASSGGRKVLNPSACYRVSAVDNVSNESDKTAPKCKPYLPEKPVIPEELIPDQYALHPAYPNPFNPETTIDYDLPEDVHVSILIYDITGKLIKTLVDANQTAGYKTVIWDGTNDNASPVSSGTYLIRIQAGNYSKIIKCVLLR